MKNICSGYLPHIFFLVLFTFFLSGCFTIAIEKNPLLDGDKVRFEFSGPVIVKYTLTDDSEKVVAVEGESSFKIDNTLERPDNNLYYELPFLYFRVEDPGASIYYGLDPDLQKLAEEGGGEMWPQSSVDEYQDGAVMVLADKGETLKNDSAFKMAGNFTGLTVVRMEYICADTNGDKVDDFDPLKAGDCAPPNAPKSTGKLTENHYTRDEILSLTEGNLRSQFVMGGIPQEHPDPPEQKPVTLVVKNTAGTTPTSGGDSNIATTEGGAANGGEAKCSLQTGPRSTLAIGFILLLFGWPIFILGWRREKSRP